MANGRLGENSLLKTCSSERQEWAVNTNFPTHDCDKPMYCLELLSPRSGHRIEVGRTGHRCIVQHFA